MNAKQAQAFARNVRVIAETTTRMILAESSTWEPGQGGNIRRCQEETIAEAEQEIAKALETLKEREEA